jgi:hypothetical protein
VADKKGVYAPDQQEQRDGWIITPVGKNDWKAVRQGTLNTWQIAYGCQHMIFANSRGELELLLLAEKIKADMIDLCSRLVDGIGEAADKRRAKVAGA